MDAPEVLKQDIRQHALEKLGFALMGVASPEEFPRYPKVVGNFDRESVFPDPSEVFPQCRSVIVVALHTRDDIFDTIVHNERLFAGVYHELIHRRLYQLVQFIADLGYEARLAEKISYKRAAILAGIGRVGKNTLVTHADLGSNIRLGVILTDAVLAQEPPSDPFAGEFCGDCQLCIDACPVGAVRPYAVDFGLCTIPKLFESSDERARQRARELHKHLSSEALTECNLCQKVCPYNH